MRRRAADDRMSPRDVAVYDYIMGKKYKSNSTKYKGTSTFIPEQFVPLTQNKKQTI